MSLNLSHDTAPLIIPLSFFFRITSYASTRTKRISKSNRITESDRALFKSLSKSKPMLTVLARTNPQRMKRPSVMSMIQLMRRRSETSGKKATEL
jgi:hypothetical protein